MSKCLCNGSYYSVWDYELLMVMLPRSPVRVLGYIDLHIFSYGLITLQNHTFIIGALLSRQTHYIPRELTFRYRMLSSTLNECLKYAYY